MNEARVSVVKARVYVCCFWSTYPPLLYSLHWWVASSYAGRPAGRTGGTACADYPVVTVTCCQSAAALKVRTPIAPLVMVQPESV